ncbi:MULTISPECIES: SGNH/GDSL hydrolase family protein [Streptomyces]|uniref:SGNH/GDSL hydrolase family protein n=1 Tax=Streptomyces eurythermus TaxID=42237 RepID=A0ABW6YXK1_9ACTN|nr:MULTISPECIES: SGNH/GDSL hydrolase family protein [Streptomyces]QIS73889.1 SGNH/GDSL hydrolase family protein [Streptomyces sp. DSM 40868]
MAKVVRVLAVLLPLLPAALMTPAAAQSAPLPWTGSWETAPSGTAAPLPGAAFRNVVHLSVGGTAVRVRLSNRLGTRPLRLGAVTVALRHAAGPAALPGTLRTATFHGAPEVTVPPGADTVSDTVPLPVPPAADLLVTVYTPEDSGPATYHRTALQTSYLAPAGAGRAADEDGTAYTLTTSRWYYVTGVDVRGPAAGSVVAFGDSLTDGNGSTPDTNRRWPDRLAQRLRGHRLGVLNAGIAGNRLLRDGTGPSALARLDADALDRAGVRALVVFEGINDIKGTPQAHDPAAYADAYRVLVARAHARGIPVVGVTLTPYGGYPAWTPAGEEVRLRVNAFIRTGGAFDAVADADAAVRDPADPTRIRPAYDPGDHLHFNDAGMAAVADTVRHALTRPRHPVAVTPHLSEAFTTPNTTG